MIERKMSYRIAGFPQQHLDAVGAGSATAFELFDCSIGPVRFRHATIVGTTKCIQPFRSRAFDGQSSRIQISQTRIENTEKSGGFDANRVHCLQQAGNHAVVKYVRMAINRQQARFFRPGFSTPAAQESQRRRTVLQKTPSRSGVTGHDRRYGVSTSSSL